MGPNEKCCKECGEVGENTVVNFPLYRKKHLLCLRCVAKKRKRRREERAEWRARRLSRLEGNAVDTLLQASRVGGATIPHSAELLEQLMEYFGGVAGFSGLMLKQYFDAKPGSSARTKMLEMMTRLVTTNAEQGGSKKPLVMWSEEELNAEIDQRLIEAAQSMAPRIVDASACVPAMLEVESGSAPEAAG